MVSARCLPPSVSMKTYRKYAVTAFFLSFSFLVTSRCLHMYVLRGERTMYIWTGEEEGRQAAAIYISTECEQTRKGEGTTGSQLALKRCEVPAHRSPHRAPPEYHLPAQIDIQPPLLLSPSTDDSRARALTIVKTRRPVAHGRPKRHAAAECAPPACPPPRSGAPESPRNERRHHTPGTLYCREGPPRVPMFF